MFKVNQTQLKQGRIYFSSVVDTVLLLRVESLLNLMRTKMSSEKGCIF